VNRQPSAMFAVILGVVSAPALGQASQGNLSKLQGTWTAAQAERNGKPADDVVGHRLIFENSRFEIQSVNGQRLYAGTVRLDPGTRPAAIDSSSRKEPRRGRCGRGSIRWKAAR
jgi:uncharacterized protein (TIGR03067 family)